MKKTATPEVSKSSLLPYMDYLHGDIPDDELRAACEYEYARESRVLIEAARLSAGKADDIEVALGVEKKFRCGAWFMNPPWSLIWKFRCFPRRGWNQLTDRKRADIRCVFPLSNAQVQPLFMNQVCLLDAMGIFDKFKEMAAQSRKTRRGNRLNPKRQRVYPVIQGWPSEKKENQPWIHALFTLDFTKTKKRLRQEFEKWLDLPKYKHLFRKDQYNPVGKTGEFKDRLKDLAAWRLLRGFEGNYEEANRFANEHRKEFNARTTIRLQLQKRPGERKGRVEKITYEQGEARPFHDARRGQSNEPFNEADLYSEATGWLEAKARTQAYLGELMPWEFGKFAQEQRSAEQQFKKRFWDAYKRAKKNTSKISKSSS